MFVAEIAPQVDRLVWTVNHEAADREMYRPAFERAGISNVRWGALANFVPAFTAGPIPESIMRRRYRYTPPDRVTALIDALVSTGCVEATPDGFVATERLRPAMEATIQAFSTVAEGTWRGHDGDVAVLSAHVRTVLDTAPGSPLLDAWRGAEEPASACGRLHQRLAILRLVRNEAHAEAWSSRGLTAGDMVVLTALWSGDDVDVSAWSGPEDLVVDGRLTTAGREQRDHIESDTNRLNEPAFAALDEHDRDAFRAAITALPGTPP